MRVIIITPVPRESRHGNRATAYRWAAMLRHAGHRVTVSQQYDGARCDVLIALHAKRSAPAVELYKRLFPQKPLILTMTGTDLYHDIHVSKPALRSMELADCLIVLQRLGSEAVPPHLRHKVRPILQSAAATPGPGHKQDARFFDVCVSGHLRPVKDPFRTPMAARLLPKSSRIRVVHLGGAMSPDMAVRARAEMERNPRYHWLGELSHGQARRAMKQSHVMVISSRSEGGANVVSEALADGIPILGSRIPGNVGILGDDYPGYFTTGDSRELARLLYRVETDPAFLQQLKDWCTRLKPLVAPAREQEALLGLLAEVHGNAPVTAPAF